MRNIHFLAAFVVSTFHLHLGAMFLAALFHGIKSLFMAGKYKILILVQEMFFEFADD